MEDLETIKEAIDKMKEIYMNLLSDRNHLLELTNIYHHALRKEEDVIEERLGRKLEPAYDSLENTEIALKESKLHISQLLIRIPHIDLLRVHLMFIVFIVCSFYCCILSFILLVHMNILIIMLIILHLDNI